MTRGTVLILGARSDIAIALAHQFAKENYDIQLASRKANELSSASFDLEFRHKIIATIHEFDALNLETHLAFVNSLPKLPDIAICAVGYMQPQSHCENDFRAAIKVIRTNFEGPANILGTLASYFEKRGSGCLVGISSVAGDRGRASNYVYGSSKAGFTAYLSGLRNRLAKKGVHVVTVLPGFVSTKMTDHLDLPPRLTAEPSEIALCVYKAVQNRKNIVYHKKIWAIIMLIIRNIPEQWFKYTKF